VNPHCLPGSARVVAATLVTFTMLQCQAGAESLVDRLLATESQVTSFATVLTEHDWDTVCYLDPYSFPSKRLSSFLEPDLSRFRYLPSDRWIDEEENSLAFVDYAATEVHVYAIQRESIRVISGPRCIRKEHAFFLIQEIDGLNISYAKLTCVEE